MHGSVVPCKAFGEQLPFTRRTGPGKIFSKVRARTLDMFENFGVKLRKYRPLAQSLGRLLAPSPERPLAQFLESIIECVAEFVRRGIFSGVWCVTHE